MTRTLIQIAVALAFLALFFVIVEKMKPDAGPVIPGAGVHGEELQHDLYGGQ